MKWDLFLSRGQPWNKKELSSWQMWRNTAPVRMQTWHNTGSWRTKFRKMGKKKIKRIFKAQSFLCSRKPALRKQEATASVIGSGNYAHQCPKYGTHWGHQHWVHFWQGRAPSTLQQHRQPHVAVSSSPSWCASPTRALQAGNKIQGCCTGARVCWQWLKKELKKKPKNLKIWGETFSNTQHNRYRINEVSVFFFLKSLSVRLPSSYPKERVFH